MGLGDQPPYLAAIADCQPGRARRVGDAPSVDVASKEAVRFHQLHNVDQRSHTVRLRLDFKGFPGKPVLFHLIPKPILIGDDSTAQVGDCGRLSDTIGGYQVGNVQLGLGQRGGDVDEHRFGRVGVSHRVGRSEADGQRLGIADRKHRARWRRVVERAGNGRCGIELSRAQRGSESHIRRIGPCDHRNELAVDRHIEGDRPGDRSVIGGIGWREVDGQCLGAGSQHRSRRRGVLERAGNVGGGIELDGAEDRSAVDGRGIGPGDDGNARQHRDGVAAHHHGVIGCGLGGEGDHQDLIAPDVQDRAGGRIITK